MKYDRVAALIAIASLPLAASPANADAWCQGTVTDSWVGKNGAVLFKGSWNGLHVQICNIKSTWKDVTPEVCAAWVAKLDSAVALSRPIEVTYLSETDCIGIASYAAAPSPDYVRLQ